MENKRKGMNKYKKSVNEKKGERSKIVGQSFEESLYFDSFII